MMEIINCIASDIDEIFDFYSMASAYQKTKVNVVVWPVFDRQMVATEIAENRQWKLLIDNKVACVWATTFTDEQIWEERNADAAVYIHRIACHTGFRGFNFVAQIVQWAIPYAKKEGKNYVRLDTLGHNTGLIAHYTAAGFTFLGLVNLKDTSQLPAHYHHAPACLFEIQL